MTEQSEILKLCASKDVLDVGCVGESCDDTLLHAEIEKIASSVVGIDINTAGIQHLEKMGYNVLVADAESFDLGSVDFDVIVASNILDHLSNAGRFLTCCRLHLRDAGILVITMQNIQSAFVIKEGMGGRCSKVHKFGETPQLLRNLLEANGWKVGRLELLPYDNIPTRRGRLVTKMIPKFMQPTIFCVANKEERG